METEPAQLFNCSRAERNAKPFYNVPSARRIGRRTMTRAGKFRLLCAAFALVTAAPAAAQEPKPLTLHPDNPHYFLFRGKPAVLITSGEHYGAVLNRDFDYAKYLDELHARKLNLTRTFAGTYREVPGSFGITANTLAPRPGRYACPWAR